METIEYHILNIQNDGFTIIKNGIDKDLIDKVVSDFDCWSALPENNFKKFNKDRVTNFHIYNENTKNLVTNFYVNRILETIFKKEQVIYSSLFFREGTAQHYHRDTPHFYTNPIDNYYGVWYALEDININAGPLKYYIGSHKLECPDGYECFNNLLKTDPNYIVSGTDYRILIEYNKNIEDLCKENNLQYVDEKNYINKINKGDIIIWHPKLLHGGSDIIDPTLTRYSMVTHNVPINTQVFSSRHFFATKPTNEYLENKFIFKYIKHNDINIVDHNIGPSVQKGFL
jgi:ectoine hydroxylase-related dioxygenase (phytanoyl-CoA dioxygenase family)